MNEKNLVDSLRSLHDLSKAINSTLKVDEVVEMILRETALMMKSEKVIILLLEGEKSFLRALRVHGAFGFDEGELTRKIISDVRPFDHCIVHKGAVITLAEILVEADYQALIAATPALADMVFAPLEIKGEAYGLLGILDHIRAFSEMELEIFCSMASQSAVAMENSNLYKQLKETFIHTAATLAEAISSRDPYTGGHVKRVMKYSLKLAERMGLPEEERERLRLAAILHDVGKIGIDDAILRKSGRLSPEEAATMKEHPEIGARILKNIEGMEDVVDAVRHHHEHYDGSGYPDGLKGEDIPLYARIVAFADAYDSLTTDRPYRKAISAREALKIFCKNGCSEYDPYLTDLFFEEIATENKL